MQPSTILTWRVSYTQRCASRQKQKPRVVGAERHRRLRTVHWPAGTWSNLRRQFFGHDHTDGAGRYGRFASRMDTSLRTLNEVKITSEKRISRTEKWRYWSCELEDDSKVSVNIQTKPDGQKSMLAINHDKLRSADAVEQWRSFWRQFYTN